MSKQMTARFTRYAINVLTLTVASILPSCIKISKSLNMRSNLKYNVETEIL